MPERILIRSCGNLCDSCLRGHQQNSPPVEGRCAAAGWSAQNFERALRPVSRSFFNRVNFSRYLVNAHNRFKNILAPREASRGFRVRSENFISLALTKRFSKHNHHSNLHDSANIAIPPTYKPCSFAASFNVCNL